MALKKSPAHTVSLQEFQMKKQLALVAALAGLFAASSANAAVITQSDSFGYATTNWTHALTAMNLFDGSLGVLNSVTVTLTGAINQSLRAENTGGSADILTPNASGILSFRNGGVVLTTALPNNTGGTFSAAAYDGLTDFAGASGVDFGILSASDTEIQTFVGGSLAQFIGVGTMAAYNLRAQGNGFIDSDNGNLDSSVSTSAFGSIELVYNYTVPPTPGVPEPATLGLLGLGLLGLGLSRRKRAA